MISCDAAQAGVRGSRGEGGAVVDGAGCEGVGQLGGIRAVGFTGYPR